MDINMEIHWKYLLFFFSVHDWELGQRLSPGSDLSTGLPDLTATATCSSPLQGLT